MLFISTKLLEPQGIAPFIGVEMCKIINKKLIMLFISTKLLEPQGIALFRGVEMCKCIF